MSGDHSGNSNKSPISWVFEYSGFLLIGTVGALFWANATPDQRTQEGTLQVTADATSFSIPYEIKENAVISIAVATAEGEQLRELIHFHHAHPGKHTEKWDGRAKLDGEVKRVEPGEYRWYVVEHGSYTSFVHTVLVGASHHHDNGDGDGEHADGASGDGHGESSDGHGAAAQHGIAGKLREVYTAVVERPDAYGHNHGINIHFLINDILMALFFAIAGKEVFESLLPGGALSNPRKAATPLLATVGGIVGPAGLYALGVVMFNQSDLMRGWAIPCATDIAFSYLVARVVFGAGHPAIAFLLLLAIADDAAGLIILAVFYPSKPIELQWFILTLVAIVLCYVFRKMRLQSFWWYLLIPGTLSWISFDLAGIHAALGLVPIIPCLPHAHTDLGIFARQELKRHDTLNEFEHWWKNPVEVVLGLFGLANAGVVLSSVGLGTWLVLVGLLIGKPLGITLFTLFSEKVVGLEKPEGMTYRHIISLGMIAAIGFTVALFVSTAAFPQPGLLQDSVKMGALLSFAAAIVSYVGARMLGVKPEPQTGEGTTEAAAH